jgi:hypothetical protein
VTTDQDELASIVLEYTQGSKLAALHQADALMPVVEQIAARRLRAVADSVRKQIPGYIGRIDTADSIDDLAAILDPS